MRKLLLLLLIGLAVTPVFAQFTSSVQGTVTDPDGAVVVNAAVALLNTATGVTNKTTTNNSGQYRFLSLPPGNYTVTVSMNGFEETTVQALVQTEATAGVNFTLKVGSTGQKVTVTAEAPNLNPEETRLQYTLEASDLVNLPSQNHSTLNFIRLAPGATGVNEGSTDITPNRNLEPSSANGLSSASNLYTLDNVPINSVLSAATAGEGNTNGAIIFTPNPDSLAEIALQTATFNVDYGTTASMQFGMATKSGTNTFHGSADYLYNDKILNAPAYLQSNTVANHRTVDAFAFGGPIIKDHTFVFGAYEHFGSYGAGSGTAQWWTPEFQQYMTTADAKSVNVQKFMLANPASRLINDDKNNVLASTVFGSKCGTDAAFNVPCSMAVTFEGVAATPSIINGQNWNIRGDQVFNGGRDRIYGFFFHMNQTSNSQSPNPTWDGETPSNGWDFTTNYTHTFTPNLLNSATFAITKFTFQFTDTPHSTLLLQMPFLTSIFDAGSISGFTRFVPFGNQERQVYGRDAVLWTKGKHSFSFGLEAANNYGTDTNYVYARPFFNFYYSTLDFFNDHLDFEQVLAHFSAVSGQYQPYSANTVNTRFGLYAQDSWKVAPRLTVNYGLRWDDLGNPEPYTGSTPWANTIYASGASPTEIASTIASRSVKNVFSSSRILNFLPRGGFAWTPSLYAEKQPLVIRGGIGLFQNQVQLQNVGDVLSANPPFGTVGDQWSFPNSILTYGTQSRTPPYGFVFPSGPTGTFNPDGSPVGSTTSLGGFDRTLAIPKTILWNLAAEQQLPDNLVFSLTYAGTHSYNMDFVTDLNRPAANDYCTIDGETVLPNGTTCTTPTSHPVNPNWGSIKPRRDGLTANYNALIAQLRQRWHTLNWQASYTWGHALDSPTGDGNNGYGSTTELQYSPTAQYSNADFDTRQRFTSSYAYQIPIPQGMNGVLRQTLGNWTLGGVVIAQTGTPFTPYYSDQAHDFTGSGGNGTYYTIPDYLGTQRSGWSKSQIKAGIFSNLGSDPSVAFPAPACGLCIGNSGRNQFWGPGYVTWDQSVVKNINLPWFGGSNSVLSIRGQAFNLLNKVNFLNPVSNSAINAGSFGQSPGANQGRVIDVGGRFQF